jgi:hypothetical protein
MHPYIVPFLGITNEPILVWARTPGVELNEYINNHPDTNRLDIVSVLLFTYRVRLTQLKVN